METEKQIYKRLKQYIKEEEAAKKRNAELAQNSFENWSKDNIEKIGRANGVHIKIKRIKQEFGKIWRWLIGNLTDKGL